MIDRRTALAGVAAMFGAGLFAPIARATQATTGVRTTVISEGAPSVPVVARQPRPIDQPAAGDRDVVQPLAPDQRVAPVRVAEILIVAVGGVDRRGGVVAAGRHPFERHVGREDRGAGIEGA